MKTIKDYSLLVFLIAGIVQSGFPQECQWTYQSGGSLPDRGFSVTSDLEGNTYVAGYTESSPCFFQTDTLLNGNTSFLIKYNSSGTEDWVVEFSSVHSTGEFSSSISRIEFDTIIETLLVTGTFYNYLILPDTSLIGDGLTVFVLTMDTDGNINWARSVGGPGKDVAFSIGYDSQSNIYISGASDDSISFNQLSIIRGGFIAKYDWQGNHLWSKTKFRYYSNRADLSNYPYTESPPWNLKVCNNALIINGKTINDTIIIDTVIRLLPEGYYSSYIASFTLDGSVQWFRLAGGPQGGNGYQLASDGQNNLYIAGLYGNEIFNYGLFDTDTLFSNTQYGDAYIAKYSINGDYQWSRNLQASVFSWGQGLHADASDNIYVSGYFSGNALFGEFSLTSVSNSDMFLTKYSGQGLCLGVRQYSEGQIPSVEVSAHGDVCFTGSFKNTLEIGSTMLFSRGWSDLFIAKCSPITSITPQTKPPNNSLVIFANPNTGLCQITIPDEFLNEKNLVLKIYDQKGRPVQQSPVKFVGDSIKIDIRSQAKGIYMAILSNGNKTYQGKIIFE